MEEYMKDISSTTKKMAMAANCTPMGTYTLDNLDKTKNMEKVHFIGSVYVLQLVLKILNMKFSNIMDYGGVGYLMAKENIKNPMVFFNLFRGCLHWRI